MASKELYKRAASAIAQADAVLVTAGAGIGVDSGLPDFRGNEGFWRAYPPMRELGVSFQELANPEWWESDPCFAWGFYGHRLNMYRSTEPHDGYKMLFNKLLKDKSVFVFTSNVDGHFQKAGLDPESIVEVHGSIHYIQPVAPFMVPSGVEDELVTPADNVQLDIDESTFRVKEEDLPTIEVGGKEYDARPNILQFGDAHWLSIRTDRQLQRYKKWKRDTDKRHKDYSHCVIDIGSGSAVPTCRMEAESYSYQYQCPLIRINPREPRVPANRDGDPDRLGLSVGALEAIQAIEEEMQRE
eukprot:gb/GECG01006555.1/.p1 GENE.gb/GECG01006555.1/~~gb/GECG01006555.1/.p1  ORF type:complete len:299 (+),score=39.75 gb/GECG01006555.1/:1-897(+)